jgi:LacI family transcriptional regulator
VRSPRKSSQSVTIKAVAEMAGVSAMSVSNVVNGKKKVRDATRLAVLDAVASLGYAPNAAARSLASAAHIRLGLICSSTENAFLSSVLVGVVEATTRAGAQIILKKLDRCDRVSVEAALLTLQASGASAIVTPPPYCELISRLDLHRQLAVPVVAMSPGAALPNMAGVRIDDFAAAKAMTARLIELGHRCIGFVKGDKSHIISRTRYEGYVAALADAGLAVDPGLVFEGNLLFSSGLDAAQFLFDRAIPPTAIFASNDDMAAAIVSVAHRRGLSVPEDVSVAGFDDSPIATKIWPTLTTIRQPVAAIADAASAMAIAIARSDAAASDPAHEGTSYLPFEIVERESTAPPSLRVA